MMVVVGLDLRLDQPIDLEVGTAPISGQLKIKCSENHVFLAQPGACCCYFCWFSSALNQSVPTVLSAAVGHKTDER